MTQTDYIKRGKPKATGRKPSASKKTTNSRSRASKAAPAPTKKPPLVAIVLLCLALSAFGYLLWTINGAADDTQPIATKPQNNQTAGEQPLSANTPQTQQPDIPAPPKHEQWQYIDELKSKEVTVEKAQIEQKGPYVMQCATFKDARRAEAFKAQLALLGFESRIKATEGTNGTRYRVQLGPYEKNRDAQADRHKLSKHNINGCKIWLWS